jgi:hypothetical protein
MSSADRTLVEGLAGLAGATRSLNDIVAEIVCGLASGDTPSKGYAYTVVEALAKSTRELGGTPSLDVDALAGWEGQS